MTLPALFQLGYTGTTADYRHLKSDRSGAVRLVTGQVSVPSGTATTTIAGLAPFEWGAKLAYGSALVVDALGTSVTLNFGYIFDDNTNNTNNLTAFVSGSTTAAAGGLIVPNVAAGTVFRAAPANSSATSGNGWFAAQIGGATTGSAGNISYSLLIAYDQNAVGAP